MQGGSAPISPPRNPGGGGNKGASGPGRGAPLGGPSPVAPSRPGLPLTPQQQAAANSQQQLNSLYSVFENQNNSILRQDAADRWWTMQQAGRLGGANVAGIDTINSQFRDIYGNQVNLNAQYNNDYATYQNNAQALNQLYGIDRAATNRNLGNVDTLSQFAARQRGIAGDEIASAYGLGQQRAGFDYGTGEARARFSRDVSMREGMSDATARGATLAPGWSQRQGEIARQFGLSMNELQGQRAITQTGLNDNRRIGTSRADLSYDQDMNSLNQRRGDLNDQAARQDATFRRDASNMDLAQDSRNAQFVRDRDALNELSVRLNIDGRELNANLWHGLNRLGYDAATQSRLLQAAIDSNNVEVNAQAQAIILQAAQIGMMFS
jgi:hypothetical protein